jgi:hypothetical protein
MSHQTSPATIISTIKVTSRLIMVLCAPVWPCPRLPLYHLIPMVPNVPRWELSVPPYRWLVLKSLGNWGRCFRYMYRRRTKKASSPRLLSLFTGPASTNQPGASYSAVLLAWPGRRSLVYCECTHEPRLTWPIALFLRSQE